MTVRDCRPRRKESPTLLSSPLAVVASAPFSANSFPCVPSVPRCCAPVNRLSAAIDSLDLCPVLSCPVLSCPVRYL